MPKRRLPACPDIEFLKREAKELLTHYRREKPEAISDFGTFHPVGVKPKEASLVDAQLVLARSYRFSNWTKLRLAASLGRAIYESDLTTIRSLLKKSPELMDEPVRGCDTGASWGIPIACAQYYGRPKVYQLLVECMGGDEQAARQRAIKACQNQLSHWFIQSDGSIASGAVMNPCETLNADGLEFLLDRGAKLADAKGNPLAPTQTILETYSRYPNGKHRCLALCEKCGAVFPDTPMMAFHRGRLDLLDRHFQRNPQLVHQRFRHEDIYPPEMGCGERSTGAGLHGTPLHGTTLLHLAVDFDEWEIAEWLVKRGADVNATASVDDDGFGGHTPLFAAVVSQPAVNGRQAEGQMARWLLDMGANPNARATLRKGIRYHGDQNVYTYKDVTPLSWGKQFHSSSLVNEAALKVLIEFGGSE